MIWFIIGLVAAIAIIIYVWCDNSNDLTDKIGNSIITLLTSLLISLTVYLCASGIIFLFAKVEYSTISDTKIVALKDNQNINGSFYIMGGYIEEDLYYYYAIETEFGYKVEKIRANNVYIKYTDGNTRIERCRAKFTNNIFNFFGFPIHDDRYVIYCPEGTITNEFNIDLE